MSTGWQAPLPFGAPPIRLGAKFRAGFGCMAINETNDHAARPATGRAAPTA